MSASTSQPAGRERRRFAWYLSRTWLRIALICICGVAARWPALRGEPIWDDEYLVRDNPFIRSPLLILETFRHYLFPESSSPHYRPVQNISYFIDYYFWNGDSLGYHISNVLWHVAGAVLLFFLLRQLLVKISARCRAGLAGNDSVWSTVAFFVALLWVVHPAHSAAVDYISGRADSLACVFSCAAWLLYLRARKVSRLSLRIASYTGAAFSVLLALASRESACMWLLIFFLHLFAIEREITRRTKGIVFAAVMSVFALYVGLRHLPHEQVGAVGFGGNPMAIRVVLMLRALGDYARILLCPTNLHMERSVESPVAVLGNAGWREAIGVEYLSIAGLLVATALCFGALRRGRAQPVRVFGVAWFVVAFLPISNLFELNATVAEHWLYLPSIGLLLFIIGIGLEMPARLRQFALVSSSFAVIALSARSFVRSGDWVTAETFYRHSLASGAAKPRIALNLALILINKADYAKAEPLLRKVVRLYPDYPIAINALAHALFRQGKEEEAQKYFALAKEVADRTRTDYPRTWIAVLNVAHMRVHDHDLNGAADVLEKARAEYPGTWEIVKFSAEIQRQLRGPAAAEPLLKEFADKNWWHADAAISLGKIFSEEGNLAQAEAQFRHASRLDIHSVDALNLIALLDVRQQKFDGAMTAQQQALARQPDQPRQYLLLSDILDKMGRTSEAHAALTQVTRLQSLAKQTL